LASEAAQGEIKHALRFTISSSSIRNAYVWPARHLTTNGAMTSSLPPMGQLFRIKASYAIPSSYGTQSKAILQALKTYGMYIADGGSNMYIQGDPSADWQDSTFSPVQSVGSSAFEAVDLSPLMGRAGFDPDSAAVPPPFPFPSGQRLICQPHRTASCAASLYPANSLVVADGVQIDLVNPHVGR